jgi:hypothetical protein
MNRLRMLAGIAALAIPLTLAAGPAAAKTVQPGAVAPTHHGPATLQQLAHEPRVLCNPCVRSILLHNSPVMNFGAIYGEGHNNPVQMNTGLDAPNFDLYHAGTFHGVTTWQIKDPNNGLCLNAAIDGQTGLFEIYEDSCPSNDPYEQFQLNARGALYISNVGVSEYFGNGVQSGDLSADESNDFVDVLDNPGNHFWDQWNEI